MTSPGVSKEHRYNNLVHTLNVKKRNDDSKTTVSVSAQLVRSWFLKSLSKNNQEVHYPKNADLFLDVKPIACGPPQHPFQEEQEQRHLKDMSLHPRIIVSLNDVHYDFYQGPNDFTIKSPTGLIHNHDFSRYFVTDWGLIFKPEKNTLILGYIDVKGYRTTLIQDASNGEMIGLRINRLVAALFLEDHPNQRKQFRDHNLAKFNKLFEVHHMDGNRLNNTYKNLQYVTKKQNVVCARGKCVVAKSTNQTILYWTMISCSDTYGIGSVTGNDTLKTAYIEKGRSYDFMGQTFKFSFWDADKKETHIRREMVDYPDKKYVQFRNVLLHVDGEPDDLDSTKYLEEFFKTGSDKESFKGDKYLYYKLFLSHKLNSNQNNVNKKFLVAALAKITDLPDVDAQITKHLGKNKSFAKAFVNIMKKSTAPLQLKQQSSSVNLSDINFALDDLYSKTSQIPFETALCEIIKHLNADDLELFIQLYLKEELFPNSTKIILDSIHIEAYDMFVQSDNSDEILEYLSNTDL
jgi:hypothetical protein